MIANAPSRAMLFLVDTGLTTWNVPFDWTNANSVECIGGLAAVEVGGSNVSNVGAVARVGIMLYQKTLS